MTKCPIRFYGKTVKKNEVNHAKALVDMMQGDIWSNTWMSGAISNKTILKEVLGENLDDVMNEMLHDNG